jgi:uncharacterized damage-inducible protein DinB
MKPFFTELYNYNHHFNLSILELIQTNPNVVSEKSIKWINHIINAHLIWNARINQQPTNQEVWGINTIENLISINSDNWQNSIKLLDTSDFDKLIEYTNSRGQTFTNSIRDILFHVINHSTHHRAQIASDLKLSGIDPPISDYIFYKRNSLST